MKSETITINGIDLEVFYQVTEGMISSSRDVQDDEDELNIIQIEKDGEDITFEIGADEFEKIEQLLVDKILN